MQTEKIRKKSKFQRDLEKKASKQIIFVVLMGCIFFCAAVMGINGINQQIYQKEHLAKLKEIFCKVEEETLNFMFKEENMMNYIACILEEEKGKELRYAVSRHNVDTDIKLEMIVSDERGSIAFTTFSEEEMNLHRREFNKIINNNVKKENKIYRTVYSFMDEFPEYVMIIPITSEKKYIGSAAVYLKGTGWARAISNDQYDTIIVNGKNDVIYCSNANLMENKNSKKHKPDSNARQIFVGENKFLVGKEELKDRDIIIYSFIYIPQNKSYLFIGVLIIAGLGILWTTIFYKILEKMAKKTFESVSLLIEEIRIIRDRDQNHEILLSTGDEIDEIADQINKMMKRIHQLNDKNIELLQINNRMEIENLQERINPHFIYNTLDTIRFLIISEPVKAENLIAGFTRILRYSINTTLTKVRLREDLKYMEDYLMIQKTRFGQRFTYQIQIDEECLDYSIPKLLLQPLVENSIKCGFKKKPSLCIKIRGKVEGDYLLLAVEDDGMGQPKSTMDTLNSMLGAEDIEFTHYGLRDINKRIFLEYGKESGMELDSIEGEYFRVILKLYMEKENVSDIVG